MFSEETSRDNEAPRPASSILVRKASMNDIPGLLDLINGYASRGVMLPRTEFELCENMRDFAIAVDGEKILGCGALHFYSPVSAEVRSLAVAPDIKTQGIGRLVVEYLIREAANFKLGAVFAFTYVPGFFERVGFRQVERGILPLKVWKDCVRCPKFQDCDEIAVLRVIDSERWHSVKPVDLPENEFQILLPVLRK